MAIDLNRISMNETDDEQIGKASVKFSLKERGDEDEENEVDEDYEDLFEEVDEELHLVRLSVKIMASFPTRNDESTSAESAPKSGQPRASEGPKPIV